ncbi:MAG: hypothetical protein M1826_006350 [Phylliscum demangeonii]|nr:MAG: hypothetical protein M1826_006350 [Phylliscum demangeonii]
MCTFLATTEIREKFQDLEWRERKRLLESRVGGDPSSRWMQEQEPEVKARNRYYNVQPWAKNRIHLRVGPEQCDYINASPIILQNHTTGHARRYIATQDDGIGDFWRMVWDEVGEPTVIVMLTQVWEAGRDKCAQYFPDSVEDDPIVMGDEDDEEDDDDDDGFRATVQLLDIDDTTIPRCTVRRLRLTVGDESRTVCHFFFAGWPDFSIPEDDDRVALLALIEHSAQKIAGHHQTPRIIHCSAGVGRSGTFIALDFLLHEIEGKRPEALEPDADADADVVFDTVNSLREQRMMMVQSDAQLGFIYDVLRERWLARHGNNGSSDKQLKRQSGSLPPAADVCGA